MGGDGSTRWDGHFRKTTVEECLSFSIGDLLIGDGSENRLNNVTWTDSATGDTFAVMFFSLDLRNPEWPSFWTVTSRKIGGVLQTVERRIGLASTQCNRYGGVRWWFVCPKCEESQIFSRRKCLYISPDSIAIGCRDCLDLSYPDARTSRRPFV